jgi:hypothetical protein
MDDRELLTPTWPWREFPVLRETARIIDADTEGAGARFADVSDATGLSADDVLRAAHALDDGGFVELRMMTHNAGKFVGITAAARREVGLWPSPENALDRMIAALEAIATNTDDEDTRTRARKILDGLTGAGKTIGLTVAAAAITGQIPGAGS